MIADKTFANRNEGKGNEIYMTLYHGSNMAVEYPRLLNQQRGLDFGAGFYLTTNEEQAVQFSRIVVNRNRGGTATVNVYEFDMFDAEAKHKVLRFDKADEKWLMFIAENRLQSYSGPLYDVVIGAVANDKVMPTVQAYLGGFLTEEATLLTLKTSKLTDQVCLKSERALELLHFTRSYTVEGV